MQIEKITWKTYTPNEFSCMICDKNRAEWRGQFRHKGITVNLCLCNVCINLPESELMERIFGNGKKTILSKKEKLDDIISDIKKHKERHILLHKHLNELLADFLKHTGKLPSKTSIISFIKWSYEETKNPTE